MIIVENEKKGKHRQVKVGDIIKSSDNGYFLICEKRNRLFGIIDLKTSYIYKVEYASISEMLKKEFEGIEKSYDSTERFTHIPAEEFKLSIY